MVFWFNKIENGILHLFVGDVFLLLEANSVPSSRFAY